MLTIRLQRAGKKNKPEYRVVLAQKTAAVQKKFLEVLGNYNPHTKTFAIKDQARLKYWLEEQHVEASPTVHNLLVANNLSSDKKVKAFTLPKKEVVEETPAETPATANESVEENSETELVVEEIPEASAVVEEEVPAVQTEEVAQASTEEAPAEEPKSE